MSRLVAVLFVVVVAAALIAGGWLLLSDAPVEELDHIGDVAEEDRDDVSRTARRSDGAPTPEAPGAESPESSTGLPVDKATTVLGRVVTDSGDPLEGASVSLSFGIRGRSRVEIPSIEAMATDADGRFRLEGIPHGVPLQLTARHDDWRDVTTGFRLALGEVKDLGDLVAEVGCGVAGVVRTAAGIPSANTRVRVFPAEEGGADSAVSFFRVLSGSLESSRSVETDDDGAFRISGLEPGRIRLAASSEINPTVVSDPIDLTVGQERRGIVLELPEGRDLEVLVRAGEAPAAGVSLRVRPTGFAADDFLDQVMNPHRAETDGDGRALLRGLPKRSRQLEVTHVGYLEQSVTLDAEQTTVTVELAKGPIIWGQVTTKHDGQPVTEFKVDVGRSEDLSVLRGAEAAAAVSVEDVEGLYAIVGLTETHIGYTVVSEGHAHARRKLRDLESGPVREDIELVLQVPFAGRVVDGDGEPVAGARVRIMSRGENSVESVLLSGFSERPRAGRPTARRTAQTDNEGRFSVVGIEPGETTLTVSHREYVPFGPETMTFVSGEPVDGYEITLQKGGVLRGLVRDAAGEPLSGATVSMRRRRPEGESAARRMADGSMLRSNLRRDMKDERTDAEGRYEIVGIPPGDFVVRATQPTVAAGAGSFMTIVGFGAEEGGEPVMFTGDEVVTLDLNIAAPARVLGRVTAAGEGVGGVKVEARSKDMARNLLGSPSATTEDDGSYVIQDLKPGTYVVTARAVGSPSSISEEIEVEAAQDVTIDLVLPGGVIRGRVVDADSGDGVAGAEVWAKGKGEKSEEESNPLYAVSFGEGDSMRMLSGGPGTARAKTDDAGYYELSYVAAGEFDVSCKHSAYSKTNPVAAVVVEGEVTDGVDLSVSAGGAIEVRATSPAGTRAGRRFGLYRFVARRVGSSKPVTKTNLQPKTVFEGLEPGPYDVTVTAQGKSATGRVNVVAGAREILEVELK